MTLGSDNRVAHAVNAPALDLIWMVSPALQVGAGSFGLSFRESHQFEGDHSFSADGGVIESSANNGSSWTPLPAAAIVPGHDGTITACCENPLGGRAVFTGSNAGRLSGAGNAAVSLGSACAGQSVRIRFGIATDFSRGADGWNIDDVSFTGIIGGPFRSVVDNRVCTLARVFANGFDSLP